MQRVFRASPRVTLRTRLLPWQPGPLRVVDAVTITFPHTFSLSIPKSLLLLVLRLRRCRHLRCYGAFVAFVGDGRSFEGSTSPLITVGFCVLYR